MKKFSRISFAFLAVILLSLSFSVHAFAAVEKTGTTTITAIVPDPTGMTCTVSFDANGGTGTMAPATVEKGAEYTLPANGFAAPDGKVFDKWDKGTVGTKITVNEDVTVTAQWKDEGGLTPETCTVSFDANGGTGTMAPVTVEKGTEYTLPANGFTAPDGKVFNQWDKGAVDTKITVDEDVTVTAQWKDEGGLTPETCTVSFDANGGTGTMAPVTVEKGTEYTLPANGFTAPGGKVFDQWDMGAAGAAITVNEDVTVTAQWKDEGEPTPETCTVSFDANGGTGTMNSVTVEKGAEYVLPANGFIAPDGKVFDQWDKGAVDTKITVDEDVTVVAQWKDEGEPTSETCTVSFAANGGTGTMAPVTVEKGTEYTLPANGFTAPGGKVFDQWDMGAAGAAITVNEDVTVTAQWKDEGEPTPETCTVSFDANGGTGTMNSVTVEKGAEYVLPANGFTAPGGKVFYQWDMGATGAAITVNEDVTVTALWKDEGDPMPETCIVSFDANGGTGTMDSVTVEKGTEYSLPNNGFTAPENKEFDKWDLGTPGTRIIVNSDIVVKAQWKDKEPPAEEYKFTFTKLWQGDHEKSIDWVLYHSDGTVAHKKFNKTIISKNEWHYETTLTTDEDYYIIEVIPAGYQVRYENVGAHAGITDRCYNGGKIINYKVPKTGDTADLKLWISMVLAGISIVCVAAVFNRKKKRQD